MFDAKLFKADLDHYDRAFAHAFES